jgi:hypothetical protein
LIENNLGKGGRDRKQIGRTMRIWLRFVKYEKDNIIVK